MNSLSNFKTSSCNRLTSFAFVGSRFANFCCKVSALTRNSSKLEDNPVIPLPLIPELSTASFNSTDLFAIPSNVLGIFPIAVRSIEDIFLYSFANSASRCFNDSYARNFFCSESAFSKRVRAALSCETFCLVSSLTVFNERNFSTIEETLPETEVSEFIFFIELL